MFGVGKNAELQRTIDAQQAQIDKYQKKLKDVIRAYKGVLAEKQALEESLQALSSHSPPHSSETSAGNELSTGTNDENQAFSSPKGIFHQLLEANVSNLDTSLRSLPEASPSSGSTPAGQDDSETGRKSSQDLRGTESPIPDRDQQQESADDSDASSVVSKTAGHASPAGFGGKQEKSQEERILTLKQALRTLTHEKSRIESALTEDKKKLLEELSAVKESQVARQADYDKAKSLSDQQLNEIRASLRQAQCERECEQSDHAAMLKELQQKLAQERMQNEHMTKEISSLKKGLEDKENEPFVYQDRIGELTAELSRMKTELQEADKLARRAPQLVDLQKTMKELKAQHKVALEQEQRRALEAEGNISKMNMNSEERVNALETKTSELSAMLGEYERQRQQDLAVIEKLRLRTQQLDQENTALAKAAMRDSWKDEDWASLTEKLNKIGTQLKHMQPPIGASLDFYELLELESPETENAHKKCRADMEVLRDEFEKYKLRAQAVLKTKAQQKDGTEVASGTVEHLRSVIASLQQKLQDSEVEVGRTEARYQDTVNGLRHTIAEMQTSQEKEVAELRQGTQQRINDAEREMHKQRERTLEVLSEKEHELEAMRTILSTMRDGSSAPVPTDPKIKERAQHNKQHSPGSLSNNSGEAAAGKVLASDRPSSPESVKSGHSGVSGSARQSTESPFPWIATGEAPNVYYSQELAKKEKEISYLRRDVRQLESAMRDLQHSAVTKELQHYDTIEKLKEEIRALEGKLKLYSEDANIEYLRNVIVKYMLCESPQGKEHMLKAIAVVLKLSQKELEMVRKHNASWYWWNNAGSGVVKK